MSEQTRPFRYNRADFIALADLGRPRIVTWLFRLAGALFAIAGLLIAFLLLHRNGSKLSGWVIGRVARRNGLLREQVMTVADDCFRAESSRGKTEIRWSAVPKIRQTEGRLFVYLTRRQAFIVPRRAFEADEDFNAFAQAAKHHWEQHHRL